MYAGVSLNSPEQPKFRFGKSRGCPTFHSIASHLPYHRAVPLTRYFVSIFRDCGDTFRERAHVDGARDAFAILCNLNGRKRSDWLRCLVNNHRRETLFRLRACARARMCGCVCVCWCLCKLRMQNIDDYIADRALTFKSMNKLPTYGHSASANSFCVATDLIDASKNVRHAKFVKRAARLLRAATLTNRFIHSALNHTLFEK